VTRLCPGCVDADGDGYGIGADCLGPVNMLAPKLGTCTIAGAQMRICDVDFL
jgi:hypothetical protein